MKKIEIELNEKIPAELVMSSAGVFLMLNIFIRFLQRFC